MSKPETDKSIKMRDMEIFNEIRNYIRRKINNTDDVYYDIWPQKSEIFEFIRRTVEFRESNSAIICGPPGCGKTALVENIFSELRAQGIINEGNAVVIKLNGLLHTDDRLALKDISRQLKLAEGDDETKIFSSFQENLGRLLEKLRGNGKPETGNGYPCIVFVLDEFHLFCSHKNQILLYNLFDVAQSAKAPVCVLGVTYYTDVMDLLEKRVLSRFSHRVFWLSQSTAIEDRLKLFKEIFHLKHEDLPNVDEIYKVLWNVRIDELSANEDVASALRRQLELDPSQSKFRNLMFKLFNTVTFEVPLLTADKVKSTFATADFHLQILSSLSLLEMALVIAMKHQTVNYEREPFNFEMIYSQYLKFCKRNSTSLITERSVVMKGFQRLQGLEIVVPVKKAGGSSGGKVPIEYRLYNFNLTEEQVNEGVKLNTDLTTDLRQWAACSV